MRSGNSRRRAFLQRLRAEPRRIRDGTKARSGAFRQNAEARRPSAEAEAPAAAGAAHAAETPDGARRCDCDFVRLYGSESFFEHLSACKQRLAAGIAAPARVRFGRARAAPDRSGAVAQRHAAGASRCEGRAVAAGADD